MMRSNRLTWPLCLVLACSRPPDPAEAFRSLCASRWHAVEPTAHQVVEGEDGFLFFGPEMRHISHGAFWGPEAALHSARADQADPLPVILDFKSQLDRLNVHVLVVPVPPKALVYPDKLDGELVPRSGSRRLDPFHQAFYDMLRRQGVPVLDLLPVFLAARETKTDPLYCRTDTHWSGHGCAVAAQAIARELQDRGWVEASAGAALSHEWRAAEILGDLATALERQDLRERVPIRVIGAKTDAGPVPVPPDRSSPVLLLGDSHCLVFHAGDDMHAGGAGLPDQLALELGSPVDLIAVRGSGATPARINLMRRARSSPGYLAGKRVIIWCFAAREFTESTGWQKVALGGNGGTME